MVDSKRDGGLDVGEEEPYDHGCRKDGYWKLGFYTDEIAPDLRSCLAAYNYKFAKIANKEKLIHAVGRCQRGLISYEKFSVRELLGFCVARKGSLLSARMTVPRLARILETADDKATFPRFTETPAELRNGVYELHLRDYDGVDTGHDQPPITKVCAESLPVFYKWVTFTWDLSSNTNFSFYEHDFVGNSYNLTKIPAADLAQIKNFKLHWMRTSHGASGHAQRNVEFSAKISQVNNVKKIDTFFGKRVEAES